MLVKIRTILFLLLIIAFSYFVIKHYFSDKHINQINKSRSLISPKEIKNLPVLKNNTDDIIEYKNDIDNYIKNKKNYRYEDLINSANE